jgi:transposase
MAHIASGLTNYQIEKQFGYNHNLCQTIRMQMQCDAVQVLVLKTKLGSPKKIDSPELIEKVKELALANRRMTNAHVAAIISAELGPIGEESVRKIRKHLGIEFLLLVRTFYRSEQQIENRLNRALKELENPRDWGKVLLPDECYVRLGEDNRPIWRRRGETGPDVEIRTKKFGQKVSIFGGFSLLHTTLIIIIVKGTVDSIAYINDLIDQSGLIPDMNAVDDIRQ